MSELRLYLLIFGVFVIAGIYTWGTLKNRKTHRQQTVHEPLPRHDIPEVRVETQPAAEIDYAATLQGLTQSLAEDREFDPASTAMPATETGEDMPVEPVPPDFPLNETEPAAPVMENNPSQQGSMTGEAVEPRAPDKIIVLHIIPRGENALEGQAILSAMSELGMVHGEMEIFHHYGVGQMKMESPLFSLANMVEPGNFDPGTMSTFSTPGLVMFLCLPSPIDPQVIFELMLNTAQRLADMLGADVCDETRKLIDEKKLDTIRQSLG